MLIITSNILSSVLRSDHPGDMRPAIATSPVSSTWALGRDEWTTHVDKEKVHQKRQKRVDYNVFN